MKRRNKTIALFSILGFSFLFPLLYKWAQTGNPFTAETIMVGIVILLNTLITGGLAYVAYKKFVSATPVQLKKSILPAFIIFLLLALIVSLTLVSLGVYSFFLIRGYDTTNFFEHLVKTELPSAIKQFFLWILAGSGFFFYVIWRKAVERGQLLREENLKYKYRNLKARLNPHFLFNSLNALSELVYIDAAKADDYIQKLSGIYRYILENEEIDVILLKHELSFVQHYFKLQQVRDQDKIYLDIDVSGEEKYQIIPVSLQLLVENALKHNLISREKPLVVKIRIHDDYIIVSNALQRKNILGNTTRTGLLNLKERVHLIMGREMIVQEEDDWFVVKLPIKKLSR